MRRMLTVADRVEIAQGLNAGWSIRVLREPHGTSDGARGPPTSAHKGGEEADGIDAQPEEQYQN